MTVDYTVIANKQTKRLRDHNLNRSYGQYNLLCISFATCHSLYTIITSIVADMVLHCVGLFGELSHLEHSHFQLPVSEITS